MRPMLAVALALLIAVPAGAVKPQPPPPAPTITGILLASVSGNPAMIAAASDGRIFVASCGSSWDCVSLQPFVEVAQLPGKPVNLTWVGASGTNDLLVCLENGDLYRATNPLNPMIFSFV